MVRNELPRYGRIESNKCHVISFCLLLPLLHSHCISLCARAPILNYICFLPSPILRASSTESKTATIVSDAATLAALPISHCRTGVPPASGSLELVVGLYTTTRGPLATAIMHNTKAVMPTNTCGTISDPLILPAHHGFR